LFSQHGLIKKLGGVLKPHTSFLLWYGNIFPFLSVDLPLYIISSPPKTLREKSSVPCTGLCRVLPAPFAVRKFFAVRLAHGNEFFAVWLRGDARQTNSARQRASSALGKASNTRQRIQKLTAKKSARQRESQGARQSRGHGNDAFAVRGNPLPCVFARHRGQFHLFSFFCSIHIYINTYICCKISFYFL
jgi:hypothetical protein